MAVSIAGIAVAVDLIILTSSEGNLYVHLSRRSNAPYAGCWGLPGAFVGEDDSAQSTAERLLAEMTGGGEIRTYMEQLYTFTEVNRDPRGRVVSVAYLVILPAERARECFRESHLTAFRPELTPEGLRLCGAEERVLTEGNLAFDHAKIIETAVRRLQGKIDYTDIAYHFLSDLSAFSLGEVQSVFEAVLGTAMDASNFRRFLRKRDEETGRIEQTEKEMRTGRGRPAVLYRLKG